VDWIQLARCKVHWWPATKTNKIFNSVKDAEFLDQLSDCHLLRQDSVTLSRLVGWLLCCLLVWLVDHLVNISIIFVNMHSI
jgi:hypothetical protein